MRKLSTWTFTVLLVLGIALPGFAAKSRFKADLSGSQEVPAVKTEARGDFKLTVYKKELSFELSADGLMNITGAYIQMGKKGENGPPVAGLFGGPAKEGAFSGILAEGTLTEKNLLGEFQGKKIADLMRLLKSGKAYVNILTGTFPDGEIRGQIK
jgi:hypothetical protein